MNREVKKTINEWATEEGFIVLDPDGFDRSDPKLFERLFTKQDFLERVMYSTIIPFKNTKQRG